MSDHRDSSLSGPLRVLDESSGGGLAAGQLGVVMARAGVGKSACLVQIGVDLLRRGQDVLHVALGQSLAEVDAGYRTQMREMLGELDEFDRAERRVDMARKRLIQAYPAGRMPIRRLERALDMARQSLGLNPAAILVDGLDWSSETGATREELVDLRRRAEAAGASVWLTVQTHRHLTGHHPESLPEACEPVAELIDIGLFLEPVDDGIAVRVLHDRREGGGDSGTLLLDSSKLRPLQAGAREGSSGAARSFTLLSGGAAGAEAEFGACAERWGLAEITFSFPGREVSRRRGLVELSDAQLAKGDVSRAYLTAQMNRTYSDDASFRKILQSLWHQVSTAGAVFVIGSIQEDDTVRGGTGWAAQLARRWKKPLFVFDQEREQWLTWSGTEWREDDAPLIDTPRFAGTGTMHLTDSGRRAIQDLFRDSFGSP